MIIVLDHSMQRVAACPGDPQSNYRIKVEPYGVAPVVG